MSAGSSRILSKRLSSKLADVTEDVQDWENHLVLRVPENVADKVHEIVTETGPMKQDMAIQFTSTDMRHANVRIGQHIMSGKIFDLPCINEVMKTTDRKNVFKVANLSQVLVCSHDPPSSSTPEAIDSKTAKKEQKQWHYPHGLTPPMKSVRRRRFRKTKKKKYMDAPEVERELKRLLRADLEADKVHWKIVSAEEKKKSQLDVSTVNDQSLFGDKVTSSEDEEDHVATVKEEEKTE